MQYYKVQCHVTGASQSDLDQWLAHHADGEHSTEQHYTEERWGSGKYQVYRKADYVIVRLADERDRPTLRDAFDIARIYLV